MESLPAAKVRSPYSLLDSLLIPLFQVAKSNRTSNAATQSRQPRTPMNREVTVVLKKPKAPKDVEKPKDKDETVSPISPLSSSLS